MLATPIPHRLRLSSTGHPHDRRGIRASLPPLCSAPSSLPPSRATLDSAAGKSLKLEGLGRQWRRLGPWVLLWLQLLWTRVVPANFTKNYMISFQKFCNMFPKILWLVSLDRDSVIY
jgi:hypothetical protein